LTYLEGLPVMRCGRRFNLP